MLRLQHWIVSVYDGYATEVLCAALTFLQQLVVNIIKVQATTIVQLKSILSQLFTFGNAYGDSEAAPNKSFVRKLIDYAKKFGVGVYEKAKNAILKLLQFGKATYARAKLTIEILMKFTELVFISPRAAWRVSTLFNEHVFDVNYESDPIILEAVIKVSKDEGLDA